MLSIITRLCGVSTGSPGYSVPHVMDYRREQAIEWPILNRTLRSELHSSVTLSRNRLRGHVPQKDLANDVMDQNRTSGLHRCRPHLVCGALSIRHYGFINSDGLAPQWPEKQA